MTADEVQALVRAQSTGNLTTVNDHHISLADALVAPQMISLIARQVKNGRVKDENLNVWLVCQETGLMGTRLSCAMTDRSLALRRLVFHATSFQYWLGGIKIC